MIAWERDKRENLRRIIKKHSLNTVNPQPPTLPLHHIGGPPNTTTHTSSKEYGCSELIDEFCFNSTIHGIKYMGDRKRHWVERVWWLLAFILSIAGCSRLIVHIWQRWDRSPVIVSFAEKPTPIWQIPFPAITICPETKTQADLFNYTEMFHLINAIDNGRLPNNLTQEE